MDLNAQKEQFSVAFVRAVAAAAGVKVLRAEVDDDSIDIGLERSGGCAPKLDIQLKCTANACPANNENVPFVLKLKNYDDLRRRTIIPRLLVVMFVPITANEWLRFNAPPTEVVMKRCAWWISLAGLPDVDNTASVTVSLPYANLFTPDSIRAKLDEVEANFVPV